MATKRQNLTEAEQSIQNLWSELDKVKPDLHRIAMHGIDPNNDRDRQIISWAVTTCALQLSLNQVLEQTNFGMGQN